MSNIVSLNSDSDMQILDSMEEDFEDISEVVLDKVALTEDELIDRVAREVMQRYKPAFQELAK